jgi:acetylornithine deacetylase/succinyl-diaminopimelate desuccinylase-like protein
MSGNGPQCALPDGVSAAVWIRLNPQKYVQTDIELIEHQALREDKVREEIARRLSCVCGNFSEHDFQELVSKMAERQLLDERRQRW